MMLLKLLSFIVLSLMPILKCKCQVLMNNNKFKSIDSLIIPELDRYYTEVIVKNEECDVGQCNFYGYVLYKEKILAVVYDEKNSNCSIILATSSVVNNKAAISYLDGDIYVSHNYDKNINSVKPFIYPSSCLPDVPLPSSTYTLLQQHIDGCLNFTKVWTEYANGFGHPTGNFWAGLELMHWMTWPDGKRLRFEMKKFGDNVIYVAEYSSFKVGPASDFYRLYISGYDSGTSTVNDSMITTNSDANLNNIKFYKIHKCKSKVLSIQTPKVYFLQYIQVQCYESLSILLSIQKLTIINPKS